MSSRPFFYPHLMCLHVDTVITPECERVCRNCGVVVSRELRQVETTFDALTPNEQAQCCLMPYSYRPLQQHQQPEYQQQQQQQQQPQQPVLQEVYGAPDIPAVVVKQGKKFSSGPLTKEQTFMVKHKPRVRRPGLCRFKRQRTGTARYERDYLALIPDRFYASIGDFEFCLHNNQDKVDTIPDYVLGLRSSCITKGRHKVECLLEHFAKSTFFKSKGGGDWRLKYKLDTKVYAAAMVLYMCPDPPDSSTGYKDLVNKSTGRKANDLINALSENKAISSVTADHRLVKLEIQMYKAYYMYMHTTG